MNQNLEVYDLIKTICSGGGEPRPGLFLCA